MSVSVQELTKDWIANKLPKRPKAANKGTFGRVLVIAGSENFPGAAYLCCAAAYRAGAGLVTLVTDNETKIIISRKLPELIYLSADQVFEKLEDFNVLLVGPGLGQSKGTIEFVKNLLKIKLPRIIFDGDGLNILSKIDKWWKELSDDVVLTPHPGEMSRLTGLTINQIQSARENTAQQLAKIWHKALVLKGANTVIVSPAGEVAISPFANPLLAIAGTGDVLAGIIAGMVAQGLTNFDAACVGVFVHGQAGEILKEKFGDSGLLASELLPILPKVIKQLKMGIDN